MILSWNQIIVIQILHKLWMYFMFDKFKDNAREIMKVIWTNLIWLTIFFINGVHHIFLPSMRSFSTKRRLANNYLGRFDHVKWILKDFYFFNSVRFGLLNYYLCYFFNRWTLKLKNVLINVIEKFTSENLEPAKRHWFSIFLWKSWAIKKLSNNPTFETLTP